MISINKHYLTVEPSCVCDQCQKKQKNNSYKTKNKIKLLPMKNINLLPTQTMLKCIHDMFDDIDSKAIELDTRVQERFDGFQKEVDESML